VHYPELSGTSFNDLGEEKLGMRQHTNHVIKVIATATAVITVAACGSSGSGGSGGGAANSGGPVAGASTTITAVGTSTTSGGGSNPYSTAPVMMAGKLGTRSTAEPYFFTPTPDTVSVGATVTYVFQNVNHTVTFDTPGSPANISSVAAGGVANADSTRVFPTAGTYSYHCSIHPYMTGMVVVQ
jgi:plastocyanin